MKIIEQKPVASNIALRIGNKQFQEALRFLKRIGVREGNNIVSVGTEEAAYLGLAAKSMGVNYIGFEL